MQQRLLREKSADERVCKKRGNEKCTSYSSCRSHPKPAFTRVAFAQSRTAMLLQLNQTSMAQTMTTRAALHFSDVDCGVATETSPPARPQVNCSARKCAKCHVWPSVANWPSARFAVWIAGQFRKLPHAADTGTARPPMAVHAVSGFRTPFCLPQPMLLPIARWVL